jgi:hypothetical protein
MGLFGSVVKCIMFTGLQDGGRECPSRIIDGLLPWGQQNLQNKSNGLLMNDTKIIYS